MALQVTVDDESVKSLVNFRDVAPSFHHLYIADDESIAACVRHALLAINQDTETNVSQLSSDLLQYLQASSTHEKESKGLPNAASLRALSASQWLSMPLPAVFKSYLRRVISESGSGLHDNGTLSSSQAPLPSLPAFLATYGQVADYCARSQLPGTGLWASKDAPSASAAFREAYRSVASGGRCCGVEVSAHPWVPAVVDPTNQAFLQMLAVDFNYGFPVEGTGGAFAGLFEPLVQRLLASEHNYTHAMILEALCVTGAVHSALTAPSSSASNVVKSGGESESKSFSSSRDTQDTLAAACLKYLALTGRAAQLRRRKEAIEKLGRCAIVGRSGSKSKSFFSSLFGGKKGSNVKRDGQVVRMGDETAVLAAMYNELAALRVQCAQLRDNNARLSSTLQGFGVEAKMPVSNRMRVPTARSQMQVRVAYQAFLAGLLSGPLVSQQTVAKLAKFRQENGVTDDMHRLVLLQVGLTESKLQVLEKRDAMLRPKECVICLDEPPQYVIHDCMHVCICKTCVDLVTDKDENPNPACPVCLKKLNKVSRVYF